MNGNKYPKEDSKRDFSENNEDYSDAYPRFLHLGYKYRSVDSRTIINYNGYKIICPLFRFDVSKHEFNISTSVSTAGIEIKVFV